MPLVFIMLTKIVFPIGNGGLICPAVLLPFCCFGKSGEILVFVNMLKIRTGVHQAFCEVPKFLVFVLVFISQLP